MRFFVLLPPAAALLVVGGWITKQRRSISELDEESARLRTHLATARASAGIGLSSHARKTPAGKPAKDKQPIGWREVAAQMAEMERNDGMGDMRPMIHLQQRVQSMTKEELVTALDEIAKLNLPSESRQLLEQILLEPLVEKDPELALKYFSERFQEQNDHIMWPLSIALGQWAEKDAAKASAWLDEQIAAGKFDSKTLDGRSPARILFEGEMIRILVGSDQAAAEARLAKLPEAQWKEIFRGSSASKVKEQDQKAYADLARGRIPEKEKNQAIAMIATNVSPGGYSEASAYLDRIAATPEERAASAAMLAWIYMSHKAYQSVVTREDVDKLREWVAVQSPGAVDTITGRALAGAVGKLKFADAAALALQYQASSGNDDVLIGFLRTTGSTFPLDGRPAGENKDEAIKLAEKISDPARREEVLKKLN